MHSISKDWGGRFFPRGTSLLKMWSSFGKSSACPWIFGIFAYLWIFSSIGEGVRTLTGTTLGAVCGWKFNSRKKFTIHSFQILLEENSLFSHIGRSFTTIHCFQIVWEENVRAKGQDCDFLTEHPGPKSPPRENHRIQFLDIHSIDLLFKYNCLLLFYKGRFFNSQWLTKEES